MVLFPYFDRKSAVYVTTTTVIVAIGEHVYRVLGSSSWYRFYHRKIVLYKYVHVCRSLFSLHFHITLQTLYTYRDYLSTMNIIYIFLGNDILWIQNIPVYLGFSFLDIIIIMISFIKETENLLFSDLPIKLWIIDCSRLI